MPGGMNAQIRPCWTGAGTGRCFLCDEVLPQGSNTPEKCAVVTKSSQAVLPAQPVARDRDTRVDKLPSYAAGPCSVPHLTLCLDWQGGTEKETGLQCLAENSVQSAQHYAMRASLHSCS